MSHHKFHLIKVNFNFINFICDVSIFHILNDGKDIFVYLNYNNKNNFKTNVKGGRLNMPFNKVIYMCVYIYIYIYYF